MRVQRRGPVRKAFRHDTQPLFPCGVLHVFGDRAESTVYKKSGVGAAVNRHFIFRHDTRAIFLCGPAFLNGAKAAKTETTYTTASVEKRSITNSLTGSGTLEPADAYTVTTLVSGEVLSDTFEEGDTVEKGQLLYTIDSSDVSTTESQAQTSYAQAVKAKYPTADISGTVSEVYVSSGDTVNAGDKILKIAASDDLSIDFQFSYADDGAFYVGQPAKIYVNGYAGYLDGTVAQVGGSSVASSSGCPSPGPWRGIRR